MNAPSPAPVSLSVMPGPYIRRLQQIAVAIFLQDTEGFGVTPVQYGVLLTVSTASRVWISARWPR